MKIQETDKYYWNIHFFSSLYSSRLYKDYNSIKELCEDLGAKRYNFEIYKSYKY